MKKVPNENRSVKPLKSFELPVSQQMLYGVRDELKSDLASFRLEVRSEAKKVDARFDEVAGKFKNVDARFDEVVGKFKNVDARFDQVLSKLEVQSAQNHRMLTLLEEQEHRNKYVLDGHTSPNDRLEPLERLAGLIK